MAILVISLIMVFVAFRYLFGLSWKATFAPIAAMVGCSVVVMLVLLYVIRPFVIEAFVVPTKSMAPTINPGERIVVDKLLHPRRWDIVAYRETRPQIRTRIFCKRIIGMPGDRLMFKDGDLYVNGQHAAAPAALEGQLHAFLKLLPNSERLYSDGQTITLGPDECFLVGDALENSVDSRMNGPVKTSTLIGVADLMYWPMDRIHILR